MYNEIWYIIVLAFVMLGIIWLITKFRVHAFVALILSSFLLGILCGIPLDEIIINVQNGFGTLILNVGLIYLSGTILGVVLEKTGGIKAIAQCFVGKITTKGAIWAFAFCGYIISISVNCDPGFIIVSPVITEFVKYTNKPKVLFYLALAIGLYSTHTLVPPTAGPTSVAFMLDANLGLLILFGLIVAFFSVIVGCIFLKLSFRERWSSENKKIKEIDSKNLPYFWHSILPIILPVILIGIGTLVNRASYGKGILKFIMNFGNPTISMLIAVGVAFTLVPKKKMKEAASEWIEEAIKTAAPTIFITAAGGALASVIKITPLMDMIALRLGGINGTILLPFIMSALFKTIQGSSTVAMVTTAGIFSPLISKIGIRPEICALAIGAGAMICSHTNDSYFWVVQKFSDTSVNEMVKKQVMMSTIVGISAFICVCFLNWMISISC